MSEEEKRHEAGGAYLDSALEERLGKAPPPDLTERILAAAAMRDAGPPRTRRARRLLVAALVLLGLAVVPAIHFLQEEREVAANLPQDPEQAELFEPESLLQFVEFVQATEKVDIQVHEAFGLPMSVPGEEPPPVLTLLGPGAIEELGWAATTPDSNAKLKNDLLEGLVESAREGSLFNDPKDLRGRVMPTDHVLLLRLRDGRVMRLGFEVLDLAGESRPTVSVAGLGRFAPRERLQNALRTLLFFGNMTTRYRRGVYRGEELAAESARARRVAKLRLHDTRPEHLAHLGLSAELRELDIRYSPALHSPEGLAEVALFPNLRLLQVSGSELTPVEIRELQAALPECEVDAGQPLLEMRIVASEEYDKDGVRFNLTEERNRLRAWLDEDGGVNRAKVLADPFAVHAFNTLSRDAGGPLAAGHLQWMPRVLNRDAPSNRRLSSHLRGVLVVEEQGNERVVELVPINFHEVHFTGADLARVSRAVDRDGTAAIEYVLKPEMAAAYADWSDDHTGEHCALILDGEVRTVPIFISRIPGRGRITGDFTAQEIDRLVQAIGRR